MSNACLSHKNAVVTGGGAGIGWAIARLFGREGARLAILECDQARAERAQTQLREAGIEAQAFCADVSDAESVAATFARSAEYFGGTIHLLVNNAGIAEFASVEESSLKSWERIMAVNATGTFLCSQAVLPFMKAAGGAIVNMASIAGQVGIPKMAAYCASKAAIIGLTRQMAVDCAGLGIRVNCLCPGRIEGTELDRWIMAGDSLEATQAKRAKYPIGRFGRPEEIAQAALFLAADASSFMTGAVLTIDGGMTAL
jgi:NAD(P)-dependent dehydrogenase (short-subunit alcohol dehydrogenase family)